MPLNCYLLNLEVRQELSSMAYRAQHATFISMLIRIFNLLNLICSFADLVSLINEEM